MKKSLGMIAGGALVGSLLTGVPAANSAASRPDVGHSADVGAATATGVKKAKRCRLAPVYKGRKTRFGVNLSTLSQSYPEAVGRARSKYGKLPVVRKFEAEPSADLWKRRIPMLRRATDVVISFNLDPNKVISGQYDGQLRGFFKTAPRHRPIFWNFHHEPEPRVLRGEFTAVQYRKAFRHIARIAGSFCRPNLYPTLILEQWTIDPKAPGTWRDYYPGRRYISVLGWDAYNLASQVPTSYVTPRKLLGRIVKVARQEHKRWGLAEAGSVLVKGDDGSQRARWLRKIGQYSARHDAAFVTYFDVSYAGDFELRDQPSIQAWQDQVWRWNSPAAQRRALGTHADRGSTDR